MDAYGQLPVAGGVLDQPAQYMHRAETCGRVYRAIKIATDMSQPADKLLARYPWAFEVYAEVWRLRGNS